MADSDIEVRSTKVFLVTSGDYSEYRVEAVFSTEEKAELFIARQPAEDQCDFNIEEYDLDPFEREIREGFSGWYVEMTRSGRAVKCVKSLMLPRLEGRQFFFHTSGAGGLERIASFNVIARDEEHAVKIANERRAQLVASGEWAARECKLCP